jgi:hypothetical protein
MAGATALWMMSPVPLMPHRSAMPAPPRCAAARPAVVRKPYHGSCDGGRQERRRGEPEHSLARPGQSEVRMYLKVVACEIMLREVCHVVATSPHVCDVVFLDQGFHDRVDEGRRAIQAAIDDTRDGRYEAVLLGYGLCNNLLAGLTARAVPLVVPRAHDCITVFMGSKGRYEREFAETPGTYYYTSGWLECRLRRSGEVIDQTGGNYTAVYEQYVQKYGEDNAKFLIEAMGAWTQHYERGALIAYDFDRALALDQQVRAICEERGWRYEELLGDLGLLRRWLAGDWRDEEFLVVPPGQAIRPAWDGSVVACGAAACTP